MELVLDCAMARVALRFAFHAVLEAVVWRHANDGPVAAADRPTHLTRAIACLVVLGGLFLLRWPPSASTQDVAMALAVAAILVYAAAGWLVGRLRSDQS